MAPKVAIPVPVPKQNVDVRKAFFTPVLGATNRWSCNCCDAEFCLTNSSRAVAHIVAGPGKSGIGLCSKAPADVKAAVLQFTTAKATAAATTAAAAAAAATAEEKEVQLEKASGSKRQRIEVEELSQEGLVGQVEDDVDEISDAEGGSSDAEGGSD